MSDVMRQMLMIPGESKVTPEGDFMPWPCITAIFPLRDERGELKQLEAKIRDLAGEWLNPTPSESYHMTLLAGPSAYEWGMARTGWPAVLDQPLWQDCAKFLKGQAVPKMAFNNIEQDMDWLTVQNGKITVRLKFLDPRERAWVKNTLKPRLHAIGKDLADRVGNGAEIWEDPSVRGFHVTLSHPRQAMLEQTPMPGHIEQKVRQAVEVCFGGLGQLPFGPAQLCLAPDMTRFVPWSGQAPKGSWLAAYDQHRLQAPTET